MKEGAATPPTQVSTTDPTLLVEVWVNQPWNCEHGATSLHIHLAAAWAEESRPPPPLINAWGRCGSWSQPPSTTTLRRADPCTLTDQQGSTVSASVGEPALKMWAWESCPHFSSVLEAWAGEWSPLPLLPSFSSSPRNALDRWERWPCSHKSRRVIPNPYQPQQSGEQTLHPARAAQQIQPCKGRYG